MVEVKYKYCTTKRHTGNRRAQGQGVQYCKNWSGICAGLLSDGMIPQVKYEKYRSHHASINPISIQCWYQYLLWINLLTPSNKH